MTATSARKIDIPDEGAYMAVETISFDRVRALIKVTGELDVGTSAPLWAVLQGHLAAGRRFLRLDLSGVTFLDASVLGGITRAHQDALGRRGTVVITGVQPAIARVFELTGLAEVLFGRTSRADHDLDGRQVIRGDFGPAPS
ncbi:MAG TPA: STAS domain-containing protein [Jatrophihabitans sp.]|nr:STAS domain-containing protein [Jatrophihabitans sp.]